MNNLILYIGILLCCFCLNLQLINVEYYSLGVFMAALLAAFGYFVNAKTVFQKNMFVAVLIVLSILVTGEILYLNGLHNFIFDTQKYNWYFYVQASYILVIAPLIGLHYEKKAKKHRH